MPLGADPNISDAVHDGWNDRGNVSQVRLAALQQELDGGPLASGLHTSLRSPEPEPSPMKSRKYGGNESIISEDSRDGAWAGLAHEAPKTWQLLNQRSKLQFQDAAQDVGNAINVAIDVRNRWIEESAYMLGMLAKLQLQMEAEGVNSPPLWRGMAEATPKTWQYLQLAVDDPPAFSRMMSGQQAGSEGASALGAKGLAGLEAVKLRAQKFKQNLLGESPPQQQWANNARANEARREELRQELLKAQHELQSELNKRQSPESILNDGIQAVHLLRDRWLKESAHLSMQLSQLHTELAREGRPVPSNQAQGPMSMMTTARSTARTGVTGLSSTLDGTTSRSGMDMPLSMSPMGAATALPTFATGPSVAGTFLGGLDGGASPSPRPFLPTGTDMSNYSFGSLPSGQPPPIGTSFGVSGASTVPPLGGTIAPGTAFNQPPGIGSVSLTSPRPMVSSPRVRSPMADDVPTCPNPDLVRQRGAERRGSRGGSSTGRSSLSSEERRHRRQSIQKAISGLDALEAQISAVKSSGVVPDQHLINGIASTACKLNADILPSYNSPTASGYSFNDQMSLQAGNSGGSIGMQGSSFGNSLIPPVGADHGSMLHPQSNFGSKTALAAFSLNGQHQSPQGHAEAVGDVLAQALCTPRESNGSQPPSFPVTPAQPPRQLRNGPADHSISHFSNFLRR